MCVPIDMLYSTGENPLGLDSATPREFLNGYSRDVRERIAAQRREKLFDKSIKDKDEATLKSLALQDSRFRKCENCGTWFKCAATYSKYICPGGCSVPVNAKNDYVCRWCGKHFSVSPEHPSRIFCSAECREMEQGLAARERDRNRRAEVSSEDRNSEVTKTGNPLRKQVTTVGGRNFITRMFLSIENGFYEKQEDKSPDIESESESSDADTLASAKLMFVLKDKRTGKFLNIENGIALVDNLSDSTLFESLSQANTISANIEKRWFDSQCAKLSLLTQIVRGDKTSDALLKEEDDDDKDLANNE